MDTLPRQFNDSSMLEILLLLFSVRPFTLGYRRMCLVYAVNNNVANQIEQQMVDPIVNPLMYIIYCFSNNISDWLIT